MILQIYRLSEIETNQKYNSGTFVVVLLGYTPQSYEPVFNVFIKLLFGQCKCYRDVKMRRMEQTRYHHIYLTCYHQWMYATHEFQNKLTSPTLMEPCLYQKSIFDILSLEFDYPFIGKPDDSVFFIGTVHAYQILRYTVHIIQL